MSENAPKKSFDIVMLGHFARDLNVIDGVEKQESGSGIYFGSVAAAVTGAKVGVISRLNPKDFKHIFELVKYGVEVFPQASARTSGIRNEYQSDNMDQRISTPLAFAGTYMLNEIPDIDAQIFSIAPILAGEVDMPLLQAIYERYPGKLALDLQGFERFIEGEELVFHQWPDQEEGLKMITYLKCDSNESEVATGISDIHEAGQLLKSWGPREVVLTHSAGVTVFADDGVFEASWQSKSMVGRTGRGDTMFGAYLAKRLTAEPEEATKWAAALCSLKMEEPGPFNPTRIQEVTDLLGQ
jgi:sugar/nucleoside kinase (ribokinase family)